MNYMNVFRYAVSLKNSCVVILCKKSFPFGWHLNNLAVETIFMNGAPDEMGNRCPLMCEIFLIGSIKHYISQF